MQFIHAETNAVIEIHQEAMRQRQERADIDENMSPEQQAFAFAISDENAKTIKKLIRQNDLSKASQALNSNGKPQPVTNTTMQAIQAMVVPRAEEDVLPPLPEHTNRTIVRPADLELTAEDFCVHKQGGIDLWTGGLVQPLFQSPTLQQLFARFLTAVCNGEISGELGALLTGTRLVCLPKPPISFRPVAIGSWWWRFAMKFAIKPLLKSAFVSGMFAHYQKGINNSCGCETIITETNMKLQDDYMHGRKTGAILVDCRNAFERVSLAMAARMMYEKPELWPIWNMFHWKYISNPEGRNCMVYDGCTAVGYVQKVEGVDQGDPMSSLVFAMSIQPTLELLQLVMTPASIEAHKRDGNSEYSQYLQHTTLPEHPLQVPLALHALADDITEVGDPAYLLVALQVLQQILPRPMLINFDKTILLSPRQEDADETVRETAAGLGVQVIEGSCRLLGGLIGEPKSMEEEVWKLLKLSPDEPPEYLRRLERINLSVQEKLLLLRGCYTVRLSYACRVIPPAILYPVCVVFDEYVLCTLANILGVERDQLRQNGVADAIARPTRFGGLNIRRSTDTSPAAFFASTVTAVALSSATNDVSAVPLMEGSDTKIFLDDAWRQLNSVYSAVPGVREKCMRNLGFADPQQIRSSNEVTHRVCHDATRMIQPIAAANRETESGSSVNALILHAFERAHMEDNGMSGLIPPPTMQLQHWNTTQQIQQQIQQQQLLQEAQRVADNITRFSLRGMGEGENGGENGNNTNNNNDSSNPQNLSHRNNNNNNGNHNQRRLTRTRSHPSATRNQRADNERILQRTTSLRENNSDRNRNNNNTDRVSVQFPPPQGDSGGGRRNQNNNNNGRNFSNTGNNHNNNYNNNPVPHQGPRIINNDEPPIDAPPQPIPPTAFHLQIAKQYLQHRSLQTLFTEGVLDARFVICVEGAERRRIEATRIGRMRGANFQQQQQMEASTVFVLKLLNNAVPHANAVFNILPTDEYLVVKNFEMISTAKMCLGLPVVEGLDHCPSVAHGNVGLFAFYRDSTHHLACPLCLRVGFESTKRHDGICLQLLRVMQQCGWLVEWQQTLKTSVQIDATIDPTHVNNRYRVRHEMNNVAVAREEPALPPPRNVENETNNNNNNNAREIEVVRTMRIMVHKKMVTITIMKNRE